MAAPESRAVLERVVEVLRGVKDPELDRDVVQLGFVKNMKFENGDLSFDIERDRPTINVLRERLRDECLKAVADAKIDGVLGVFVNVAVKVSTEKAAPKFLGNVKNVIAVASGKGGVGKSTTAVNLALALRETGASVGIMDADIYGPSIPLMLGATNAQPRVTPEKKLLPIQAAGLELMSMGFLSQGGEAVIWRGPMVSNMIQQFLGAVAWSALDYLVIDLPPGTGDIQLTLTQMAPLTGAVIVTTPQEVALIDARKGLKMFEKVNVPILGIIENMSYYVEESGKQVHIFGKGGGERVAKESGVPLLGQIPIDAAVAEGGDSGAPVLTARPDSKISEAIRASARATIARLDEVKAGSGSFDPAFSMEWK